MQARQHNVEVIFRVLNKERKMLNRILYLVKYFWNKYEIKIFLNKQKSEQIMSVADMHSKIN